MKIEKNNLIDNFTFETFVEGKSNHIALAASRQIGDGLKNSYNPLFIYGGVGLGKTHLMHAVGNKIKSDDQKRVETPKKAKIKNKTEWTGFFVEITIKDESRRIAEKR